MALSDVVDALACPRCRGRLELLAGPPALLRCASGHAYDVARQGYVNLLGGAQPANADTPDMLAARERFLAAGHYAPVADAVAARLGDARRLLDVGAGTGWYLARWLGDDRTERTGIALDVSTAAARRAARAHPRIGAVVADAWAPLPLRDASIDAVTCVFAPRQLPELTRVLRPGGLLVVAAPTVAHLAEARGALGLMGVEPEKQAKLLRQASGLLDAVGSTEVTRELDLTADELASVVGMGPNAHHAHAATADGMRVTLSVTVSWFRRPNL